MGIRGELFSLKMVCDERTYFFNVKENRLGDLFLSIVESKENELSTYERHSVVVFNENLDEFMSQLTKAAQAMKKVKPSQQTKQYSQKSSLHHTASMHTHGSHNDNTKNSNEQAKKPVVRIKKSQDHAPEHRKARVTIAGSSKAHSTTNCTSNASQHQNKQDADYSLETPDATPGNTRQ